MSDLHKAMAQAFPKIKGAIMDKENPHFKSRYADLASVVDAIKPALESHGLWFTQKVSAGQGVVSVETILYHESGEELSFGELTVPVAKHDCQGVGAAITYCRRFSLSSAFGVAPEDDDGNTACEKKIAQAKTSPPKTEKILMTNDQLITYANELTKRLNAVSKNYVITNQNMFDFLKHYDSRTTKPLVEVVENSLEKSEENFTLAVAQWEAEKLNREIGSKKQIA